MVVYIATSNHFCFLRYILTGVTSILLGQSGAFTILDGMSVLT